MPQDHDPPPTIAAAETRRRRRASGIYGAIVTAAILAATGDALTTRALVVAVVITLLVYWVAEEYAELLAEQAVDGHLPSWHHVRTALLDTWPMVTASYLPLVALIVARGFSASTTTSVNIALLIAVVLLIFHAWTAGRAAHLHGRQLLVAVCIAAGLGVAMIVLKNLVLTHLH